MQGFRSTVARRLGLTVATLAVLAIPHLAGDRIDYGSGFGFDGQSYGAMALDLPGRLQRRMETPYRLGRLLPSALVYVAIRVSGTEATPEKVVAAFAALNVLALTSAAWAWIRIAEFLRLSRLGVALGWAGLFLNFACLKFQAYYPVLTDFVALSLATWVVFGFIAQRPAITLVAGLMLSLTWPGSALLSVPLLLFPRQSLGPAKRCLPAVLAALVFCSLVPVAARVFAYTGDVLVYSFAGRALGSAFLFLAAAPLLSPLTDWVSLRVQLRTSWPRARLVAILLAIGFGTAQLLGHFGGTQALPAVERLGPLFPLAVLVERLQRLPGHFLVTPSLFFGPMALWAFWNWPRIAGAARELGLGAVLALLGGSVMALDNESRRWLIIWPLLVTVTVVEAEGRLDRAWVATTSILGLLWSRAWMPIGPIVVVGWVSVWSETFRDGNQPYLAALGFLAPTWLAGTCVASVVTLLIFVVIRRTRR